MGGRVDANTLPLSGIKVVELAHVLAAPLCTSMLGDLGADVVKVEPSAGDPHRSVGYQIGGIGSHFLAANRNKRSIVLELGEPSNRATLTMMLEQADVVVTNLRASSLIHLELDPGMLCERYPQLIVCEITGFAETGPLAEVPGVDLIAQAMSGSTAATGSSGSAPSKPGAPIADVGAALFAIQGILASLIQRSITGTGARVSVDLLSSTLSFMGSYVPGTAATGEELAPFGAGPRRPIPYSTFRAKDDYIVVGCATASLWRKLCDALDRPDWKFMQVNQERADQLTSQFLDMPADHWLEVLERHGVPAAKVLNLLEAIRALRISRWSDVVEEGPVGLAGVEQ